jgi:hypothetical protein
MPVMPDDAFQIGLSRSQSYVSTAVIEACTEGYGVGMSQVPRHSTEASWHS